MRKAIVRMYVRLTGKTEEELARNWTWHYFTTRSRTRAYWRTLVL